MAIVANDPPRVLNASQIAEILPHRYPFALVDRITDYEPGKWARGIKCVSMGEPYFQGHFPGQPVMPGVLILEALAQCGAVAALSEEGCPGQAGPVRRGEERPVPPPGGAGGCADPGM